MRGTVSALACLVFVFLAQRQTADFPLLAAEGPAKPAEKPRSGIVLDPAGAPAAGCKVWLVGYPYPDDAVAVDQTVTDAQGRFSFPAPKPETAEGRRQSLYYVARDAKGRIGWPVRPLVSTFERSPPQAREMQIKLVEVQDYRGRLVDAVGQPIAKAVIRPRTVSSTEFPKPSSELAFLPADLGAQLGAETAADGAFVLNGVPARGTVSARVAAAGFGTPAVGWSLDRPVTIRLDRAGSVSGSVVCASEPGAVSAGIAVSLQRETIPELGHPADFHVNYWRMLGTFKDGTFRLDGVPPNKYVIALGFTKDFPFYVERPVTVEVKPGQAVSGVSVALRRTITVQGKVVDEQTGGGIKDVRVHLSGVADEASRYRGRTARTDAQGAFTIRAQPGKATIHVSSVPEDYLRPSERTPSQPVELSKDAVLPPIRLQRVTAAEGVVVDESGKPVAGAEVLPYARDYFSRAKSITDNSGKFTLKGLSAKEPLPVRARTDKAVTDGPVVMDPSKGPIRLVVAEKWAFSLRGTLADESGRSIKGAPVNLWTMWMHASGGIGFSLATAKSDDQGRFEFRGLWPGDQYHVMIEAEGCEKYETARVRGEPGKTHDFAKIVLASARGVVEGVVVDSAGKPMAEVRVFNTGDAPQTVETRSDAAGRFRLEGLRSGAVYVFAEKPDHRFTGVRTTSGATGVSIKLLRQGEPLSAQAPRPEPLSYDQQKQIARRMLEKLWATCDHHQLSSAVPIMARLDPDLAKKWAAEFGGKLDGTLRWMLVEKAAETDIDEALSLVSREGPSGWYAIKRLADRYATTDPAKATRCAEELAVRARAMDQPGRTECMAQAGALVVRLGNKEAGRRILEEAAAMATKLGSGDRSPYARGLVAEAIAPYDLPRALALIEPARMGNERERFLVRLASAICLDDLDKALSLLKEMEPQNAWRAKVRIAQRLATTKPADALRVVDSMEQEAKRVYPRGDPTAKERAEAFAWLAVAIAPRDKAQAFALIDRGLDLCVHQSEGFRYWSYYTGRAGHAALLAVQARQIGYPDMESVVHRVLACRLTSKDEYSPARVAEGSVRAAAVLSLADPEAAKGLLQVIESRSEVIGTGGTATGREWLKAWTLADPKHAEALFGRELAQIKERTETNLYRSGLFEMAELLATPPPERLKLVGRSLGFQFPDMEY